MRVCCEPGCPRLIPTGTRCEPHRKAKGRREDKRRPTARQRGYDNQWERTRHDYLQVFSVCMDCGAPATVADHAPWTRRELLARGVTDPDQPVFLQPRCATCHNRKTATQDGGFGRVPVRESD